MGNKTSYFLIISRLLIFVSIVGIAFDLKASATADTIRINEFLEQYQEFMDAGNLAYQTKLEQILHRLEKLPGSCNEYRSMKYAMLAISESVYGNIDFGDSLSLLALEQAEMLEDNKCKAEAYRARGNICLWRGELNKAQSYFEKSLSCSMQLGDSVAMIGPYFNLAHIMTSKGNLDSGFMYYDKTVQLCTKNEEFEYLADVKINLAKAYYRQERLSDAFLANIEAINILDSIGSKQRRLYPLHSLAVIYRDMGMDSLSTCYFKEIYVSSKVKRDYNLAASSSLDIGNYYLRRGSIDSAYKYINEADLLVQESGANQYKGSINIGFAKISLRRDEYDRAEVYFNRGLRIAKMNHDVETEIAAKIGLAKCYRRKGMDEEALELLLSANDLATASHSHENSCTACKMIAELYYAKGLYTEAAKHYMLFTEIYNAYLDPLLDENNRNLAFQTQLKEQAKRNALLEKEAENSAQIVNSQIKRIRGQRIILIHSIALLVVGTILICQLVRSIAERKKNNAQLKASNEEVRQANMRLKSENEFKNRLFSIVSHDLRSPLTGLYSMLQVFSMQKNMSSEERQVLLDNLMESTEYALGLIDNLLGWTQKQMKNVKPEETAFDIKKVAQEIAKLNSAKIKVRKLAIVNSIPEAKICRGDVNIARLVLRNLLSNAIKFSPEDAAIEMNYEEGGGKAVISVKDMAGGVPPGLKDILDSDEEFISTSGKRNEKGNGLGLKLCRYFLMKSGNSLWFESRQGEGTTFYFTLDIG